MWATDSERKNIESYLEEKKDRTRSKIKKQIQDRFNFQNDFRDKMKTGQSKERDSNRSMSSVNEKTIIFISNNN